jgi:hypothetical protein
MIAWLVSKKTVRRSIEGANFNTGRDDPMQIIRHNSNRQYAIQPIRDPAILRSARSGMLLIIASLLKQRQT